MYLVLYKQDFDSLKMGNDVNLLLCLYCKSIIFWLFCHVLRINGEVKERNRKSV